MKLAGTSHRKTRKGVLGHPFFLLEYLPWAVPHLKNNRYPFRSNIKKLLKCAIDKHLFQCYHMEHGRKSCRQQNIPKRTIKRNEGALRPNNGRSAPFGAL